MNIIYLIKWEIDTNDGVTRKIKGQIDTWVKLGHSVKLYCISNVITNESVLIGNRFRNNKEDLKKLETFIKDECFDFIYFRWAIFRPVFNKILKNRRFIIEVNTDDIQEYKFANKKIISLYNRLTRTILLKKAELICFVTKELSEVKSFRKYSYNAIISPNSITFDRFYKRELEEEINIGFIGTSNCYWHGLDIIEKLINCISHSTELNLSLHIIGLNGENTKNIQYHGFLSENEYREILMRCNLAVGTMGLFKKNMQEACPLKVREYAKYRIPLIVGYKDTAFLDVSPDWVLQLPNNDYWINQKDEIEKVITFIEKYRNYIVSENEVKKYFASEVIEKNKLNNIEEKFGVE